MAICKITFLSAPAVAGIMLGASLAIQPAARPVDAASSAQSLLAQAEHNTNTVRTLVHHDQTTISSATATLKATTVGSEDEVRNREHDFESDGSACTRTLHCRTHVCWS